MRSIFTCFTALLLLHPSLALASSLTTAKNGMVVSEHVLASQVGADILKAGGNAIDAAVAVGYALAVVNPCCGNIGGGGFMLVHLANGNNVFLNFREKAPLLAKKEMFQAAKGGLHSVSSTDGYLAVAVPGTVLGLDIMLKKYGTMSRHQVMAPAIKLARNGYIVSPYEADQFREFANDFRKQPIIANIFMKNNITYPAGSILTQPQLADTLSLIAERGSRAFYNGPIAHSIARASAAHNGILTLEDFSRYSVSTAPPITCNYHGYTIFSAPPPSSGGVTLCEALGILQHFPLSQSKPLAAETIHWVVEALRYSFNDRNTKLGDPKYVNNPIRELLAHDYTEALSKKIAASPNAPAHDGRTTQTNHELTDTTHYSIVDKAGNAVAVTYSLNGFFGARIMAPHTGFFLNNQMDDFAVDPGKENKFGLVQSGANDIEPGKRPLSSMTPAIILKDNKLFMVIGSPGGPRIISAVLLTILNVIDHGMGLQQAADLPRFHYQGAPDTIFVEPHALSRTEANNLIKRGYHLTKQHTWSAIEAIQYDARTKLLYGANDRRRPDGAAVGY